MTLLADRGEGDDGRFENDKGRDGRKAAGFGEPVALAGKIGLWENWGVIETVGKGGVTKALACGAAKEVLGRVRVEVLGGAAEVFCGVAEVLGERATGGAGTTVAGTGAFLILGLNTPYCSTRFESMPRS